ncbi:zinc finger E-box-binding homeobox 1 isoform X1 [Schistocerca cancellata]|uniref:zinc finger E-box-binding homeobox 1 isoform X1 n=2 Tax=Schistocerca cancellata TaxID=274614 RepID=UPI002118CD49|nr:zinc finger E-box-binding homeobox 1 isoform X1 [Schistocerca cancellata]
MSAGYNSSEVCRLCTTGGGLRMHIFDKEGEQRQLLFKIKSCLPIMISKEDTLPKKICYRCAYKLDMFYEFRLSCLNSENMLKNVTEKQLPVENGQRDEVQVKSEKMEEVQKSTYTEAMQQHMAQINAMHCKPQQDDKSSDRNAGQKNPNCQNGTRLPEYPTTLKVPQVSQPNPDIYGSKQASEPTFVIPDDGLGFDDGVRVLRALGTWSPDYTNSLGRTGMLHVPEQHYGEVANSVNNGSYGPQRKVSPSTTNRSKGASKGDGANSSSSKSFACTVCGKGLARKDKLVIHMRIHTGEKPYICEVCNKAFARRDKLVIHMNKMKHRTPTNIAPLGKRSIVPDKNGMLMQQQHQQQQQQQQQQPSQSQQQPQPQPPPHQQPQQQQSPQQSLVTDKKSLSVKCEDDDIPRGLPLPPPQQQNISWSCELCGRMFSTRDDWMAHAKSHLDDKMISNMHHPQQHLSNGNPCSSSVVVPTSVPAPPAPYFSPHVPHHVQPYGASAPERHFCLVCRQDFTNKTDFMFHVRTHFVEGKPPEFDMLGKSNLVDGSGLCT